MTKPPPASYAETNVEKFLRKEQSSRSVDCRLPDNFARAVERVRILTEWQVEPAIIWAAALSDLSTPPPPQLELLVEARRLRRQVTEQNLWFDWKNGSRTDLPLYTRQRNLFPLLYTDLPLALLVLADHLSLSKISDQADQNETLLRQLADESQEIFLPMLRRLGGREWRCQLYELVLRHDENYRGRYGEFEKILQPDGVRHQILGDVVAKTQQLLERQGLSARVYPRHYHFHTFCAQLDSGVSAAQALCLEVVIQSPDLLTCYQLLSVVHRLGKPVKIEDYIAQPSSGGYRSLRTTIRYSIGSEIRDVKFHIETSEMLKFNRTGYLSAERDTVPGVWWQNADHLKQWRSLIQSPGSNETMLVFSPDAEPVFLPEGATALDFAYQVHSEVGHMCGEIKIGGNPVSFGRELQPGDIVCVYSSPVAAGPSNDWLNMVTTDNAKSRIKSFLNKRESLEDRGKRRFHAEFQHLISRFGLAITPEQAEEHLRQIIVGYYTSSARYFRALGGYGDEPIHAVRRIVDSILSLWVRDEHGKRLAPQRCEFALCCCPKPGDPLIAKLIEQRNPTHNHFRVHHRDCAAAAQWDANDRRVLMWVQLKNRNSVEVTIDAWNREGLTGDVLQVIYRRKLPLNYLEASLLPEAGAVLRLRIEIEDEMEIPDLQAELSTRIDRVRNVDIRMLTAGERVVHTSSLMSHNPFSPNPVTNMTMFYGRNEEISTIRNFLAHPTDTILIIAGQRRIGKTSLLHRAKRESRRELHLLPVFISFQAVPDKSLSSLAILIARHIEDEVYRERPQLARTLKFTEATRRSFLETPVLALQKWVREAHRLLEDKRLLLLFDEVDKLIDPRIPPDQQSQILACLRVLGQEGDAPKQIMVFNERVRREIVRLLHPALMEYHLSSGRTVFLTHLDAQSARRLIVEPVEQFVAYTPEAIEEIRQATGYHPFYIHKVCDRVIEELLLGIAPKDGRYQVTLEHARAAIDYYLTKAQEYIFDHLIEAREPNELRLLYEVARLTSGGYKAWCTRDEIVLGSAPHLTDKGCEAALDLLCQDGVLETKEDRALFRFAVPMVARWYEKYGQK